jgi:hypothetical protein
MTNAYVLLHTGCTGNEYVVVKLDGVCYERVVMKRRQCNVITPCSTAYREALQL